MLPLDSLAVEGPTRRWVTSATGVVVVTISVASSLTSCGADSGGASDTRPTDITYGSTPELLDSGVQGADTSVDSAATTVLDGTNQALADAIASDMATNSPVELSEAESRCWAESMVTTVGPERLETLGITVDSIASLTDWSELNLEPSDAAAIATPLFACTDVRMLAADQIAAGMGSEVANCVLDNVNDASIEALMTASLLNEVANDDVLAEFAAAGASCLTD